MITVKYGECVNEVSPILVGPHDSVTFTHKVTFSAHELHNIAWAVLKAEAKHKALARVDEFFAALILNGECNRTP